MFEEDDDDDFSFIDEDFLKEVLQPTNSCHASRKNEEVPDHEKAITILNSVTNTPSKKFTDQRIGTLSENGKGDSSSRTVVKDGNGQNATAGIVFKVDDFFDSFAMEGNFDTTIGVQSTPPDSEITEVYAQEPGDEGTNNRNSPSNSDFRTRILKTLQVNKSKTSNESLFSDSSALKLRCITNVEKRKRLHSEDINVENSGSAIKRKQIVPITSQIHKLVSGQDLRNESNFIIPSKHALASVRKSVSPGGPLIQKRKFPGPAGILPKRGSKSSLSSVQQLHEIEQSSSGNEDIVCSQSSADEFLRGPWRQMSDDLEQDQPLHASPLAVFNIKWILRRAGLRGQAGVRKIPYLAVMVRSIDTTHLDATVLLKDQTGEMSGTIVKSVLEEYGSSLQPGCVLLLRDVTLLSPASLKASVGGGEPARHHYLNVTLNTILSIYSWDDFGNIIMTTVCEVDRRELFRSAAVTKTATAPRAIVEEEEEEEIPEKNHEQKQSLFSHVNNYTSSPLPSHQFPRNSNYRTPRPSVSGPALNGSSHQQHGFRYNSPMNSPTMSHPQGSNSPRNNIVSCVANTSPRTEMVNHPPNILASRMASQTPRAAPSNVNGSIRPQKFHSPSLQQPSTQGSFKVSAPVMQHGNVIGGSTDTNDSRTNKSIIWSQQDEKEVRDLLDSIDVDSFFGDF